MSKTNTTIAQEDLSFEIVLERRERSYSYGEPRVNHLSGDVPATLDANQLAQRIAGLRNANPEHKAIRSVIEQFEKLAPSQVVNSFGTLTTAPYTSVAGGVTREVKLTDVQQWVQSNGYGQIQTAYGNPSPSVFEFTQLAIVLIDERTASATYTAIYDDGVAGTSTAILTRTAVGQPWRIAVHIPHPV